MGFFRSSSFYGLADKAELVCSQTSQNMWRSSLRGSFPRFSLISYRGFVVLCEGNYELEQWRQKLSGYFLVSPEGGPVFADSAEFADQRTFPKCHCAHRVTKRADFLCIWNMSLHLGPVKQAV